MKKRVGLLATLALCVTVGGVYATWNYTQGTAKETHATITTKLASAVVSTEAIGELIVTAEGGIKIDDVDNDYLADVSFETGTYFQVNLDKVPGGVDMTKLRFEYTITLTGIPNEDGTKLSILTYNMDGVNNILTVDDLNKPIELDLNRFVWEEGERLQLTTKAEYDAYEEIFLAAQKTFRVTVKDVTQY